MWVDDPIHQGAKCRAIPNIHRRGADVWHEIKTKTGLDAVLHLAGGELRVVDEDHFVNREFSCWTVQNFNFQHSSLQRMEPRS